jgi:hypothetical protein
MNVNMNVNKAVRETAESVVSSAQSSAMLGADTAGAVALPPCAAFSAGRRETAAASVWHCSTSRVCQCRHTTGSSSLTARLVRLEDQCAYCKTSATVRPVRLQQHRRTEQAVLIQLLRSTLDFSYADYNRVVLCIVSCRLVDILMLRILVCEV